MKRPSVWPQICFIAITLRCVRIDSWYFKSCIVFVNIENIHRQVYHTRAKSDTWKVIWNKKISIVLMCTKYYCWFELPGCNWMKRLYKRTTPRDMSFEDWNTNSCCFHLNYSFLLRCHRAMYIWSVLYLLLKINYL